MYYNINGYKNQNTKEDVKMSGNVTNYPSNLVNKVLNVDGLFVGEDKAPQIENALGSLSEKELDAVMKRYRDGMTYKSISEEFGITLSCARLLVEKAVRKLRRPENRRFFEELVSEEKKLPLFSELRRFR